MAINSPTLKRQAMQGTQPWGGFSADPYLRAATQGLYVPGLVTGNAPGPSTPSLPFALSSLRATLNRQGGYRCLMGVGEGSDWPDELGADDMVAHGGASYNGAYATFDGVDGYFETAGDAAFMTGFAGASGGSTPNTWNSSGITISCMMRVQPGDLGNRTLCHWFNGGAAGDNYCRWMLRFWEATGGEEFQDGSLAVAGGVYLQFWNAYGAAGVAGVGDDRSPYLDPVAGVGGTGTQAKPAVFDRFFTIPVNLAPLLADGRWHYFQFARGTMGEFVEKKLLFIDGRKVYYAGTGNGVNNFADFTVPISIGRTVATTIVSDAGIDWKNFKGDIAMFSPRNRWTREAEMRQNAASLSGGAAARRRRRRAMWMR